VFCTLRNENVTINNAGSGGGSVTSPGSTWAGDWNVVRQTGNPMYTIDPTSMYRLDPTMPEGDEATNPNVWTRVPNSCAIR
jgi:hypothetical protein